MLVNHALKSRLAINQTNLFHIWPAWVPVIQLRNNEAVLVSKHTRWMGMDVSDEIITSHHIKLVAEQFIQNSQSKSKNIFYLTILTLKHILQRKPPPYSTQSNTLIVFNYALKSLLFLTLFVLKELWCYSKMLKVLKIIVFLMFFRKSLNIRRVLET